MTDHELLEGWVRWGRMETLREQARRAIESGQIDGSLLLRLIRQNAINEVCVYRGLAVEPDDPLLTISVGETFDLLPSSFSSSILVAALYAQPESAGAVQVMLMLRRSWNDAHFGQIHAFDIASHFAGRGSRKIFQEEFVVAGQMEVLDVRPYSKNGRMLVLRQKRVYGMPDV